MTSVHARARSFAFIWRGNARRNYYPARNSESCTRLIFIKYHGIEALARHERSHRNWQVLSVARFAGRTSTCSATVRICFFASLLSPPSPIRPCTKGWHSKNSLAPSTNW
ncbi:hypothetical protein B5807_01380 [Epicoccum nigrum]|uniref:Uncharacterized protein n=1 Tax=Epicoccum nigrum TaxID=105696 RepID=A0A1Y2MF92_EPING|nr:hypothetical protein B5807_01380 [Epicoccum nigrum]